MAQTDSKPEYQSRFNEQLRDERAEPAEQKTRTVANGKDVKGAKPELSDEALLKQIREDYKFCLDYWSYNREQAADDVRFVLGNFWTQDEITKRSGRPCLNPDEISQYLKQTTNNYRQNKRNVKVIPRGEGATDQDAERRSAIIRALIYQSNGQAAFTTGFEGAVSSSMGFWGLTTKQVRSGQGFNVEPRIRRIPNQFTVLLGPEAKEADFSDQDICFVTDLYRKSTFPAKFAKATKTSFTVDDSKMAPDWFKGDSIVCAEAWRRKVVSTRKRLKVMGQAGPTLVYEDELRDGDKPEILDERDENEFEVIQYITNGIEILDRVTWPGSWIPIIPVLGEEVYEQDSDGKSKRVFFSLTRRMKTPQKMVAFIASQEAEEFGMAPRSPLLLWEGQEGKDKKALENLHTIPRAFILLRPGKTAEGVPLPDLPGGGRLPFSPNIQAYELAREAWRRSIQAAAGITPLPTSAQRQNEKSGIALERIDTMEAVGSYHFTDNMDRALENTGRQLNELITKVMDTPRSVATRKADETHGVLRVSSEQHAPPEVLAQLRGDAPMPEGGLDYLITDRGEFDVTFSTGPDKQSEREDQSDFVDTLIKEGPALQLPQQVLQKLVSIAVKMKDLGHFGDEIAKILDPTSQQGQQMAALQQQLAQQQESLAAMTQELQKLQLEKAGKVIDNEYKLQVTQLQNDIKVLVAEVSAKAQSQSERMEMFMKFWQENHGAAHDVAMQKDQQAHDAQQASLAQQAAAQTAQTQLQQPQP